MIRFVLKVVLLAAAFYLLVRYVARVEGLEVLQGISVEPNADGPLGALSTWLWLGVIFGVVNAVVGPILRMLSLPFVVVTLGLFLLVINAALFGITAALTDRLAVTGLGAVVAGGLYMAVAGWLADQVLER